MYAKKLTRKEIFVADFRTIDNTTEARVDT